MQKSSEDFPQSQKLTDFGFSWQFSVDRCAKSLAIAAGYCDSNS
jgi:hypothetical protein